MGGAVAGARGDGDGGIRLHHGGRGVAHGGAHGGRGGGEVANSIGTHKDRNGGLRAAGREVDSAGVTDELMNFQRENRRKSKRASGTKQYTQQSRPLSSFNENERD